MRQKSKAVKTRSFPLWPRLLEEDPTLKLERDQATAETVLSGTGQIHLETTCEKLNRKFGDRGQSESCQGAIPGNHQKAVNLLSTATKNNPAAAGNLPRCILIVSPLERGKGFEFDEALTGMNVPRNFVPAVEKGLNEALAGGIARRLSGRGPEGPVF